ncbi:MAG TPA: sulfotransferase [Caulobacteraceae bacterium]|nr:sulfotransferase [Caulobacteraceae bacterium]
MSYPVDRSVLADAQIRTGLAKLETAPEEAVVCFETAAALAPGVAAFHNLAVAHARLGRQEDATRAVRAALDLDPDYGLANHLLGVLLVEGDRVAEGLPYLRKAAAALPGHAQAQRDLAVTELFMGDLDAARAGFWRALEIDVCAHEVLFNLVRITDMSAATDEVGVLMRALTNLAADSEKLAPAMREQVFFALAKAHEERGDPDVAFAWLERGNRHHRAQIAYDGEAHARRLRRTAEVFDEALLRRLAGEGLDDDRPIFVLGTPRSGTTLVEQILAAHPDVQAGGEAPVLMKMVLNSKGAGGALFPEWGAAMTEEDTRVLGRTYLDALAPAEPGKRRLTDKRLENFEYIGLIHLCLPKAPIIHVRRDPRDAAFSCYSLLFAEAQTWSYDFEDLARFWREYDRLMAHWTAVLPPGRILEVRYESLVSDFEREARRIVEHCGLAWNDACLGFHNTSRPVRSASAAQVRQPIYDRSIGRWRPFAKHLAPLFEAMGIEEEAASPLRSRRRSA